MTSNNNYPSARILVKFLKGRRHIRDCCNAPKYCSIYLVDGNSSPILMGESCHYETKGGRRIYYPNAYAKKGRSNMVYINSTIRVEVGRDWVSDEKFFDYSSSVCFLKACLLERGYTIQTCSDNNVHKYFIMNKNSDGYLAENISVSKFREAAKRLLRLQVFS